MTVKQNCWEFKGCRREPGGRKADQSGVCPAALEKRLDGVHGGINGGRTCWVIAGTFCQGTLSGTFAIRYKTCKECDFYKKVLVEDSNQFELTMNLIKRLK